MVTFQLLTFIHLHRVHIKAEGGLSLDSRSADKEQKAVTPEKSKAGVTTFAKNVGAQIPVTQNQRWSYFPNISQID